MATLNETAGAYLDQADRLDARSITQRPTAAWVRQAIRARERALRLYAHAPVDPLAKATPELASLVEEYLEENEKLFDATCALVRAAPLDH